MEKSLDKGDTDTFSRFFGHGFWNLFQPFSTCDLSFWEFELIKAFHDHMPMEQRTKICLAADEVW
jgi:hypothetical protein